MASPLAEAHIEAQARIRRTLVAATGLVWRELGAYDRENVDEWLSRILPVVTASQRQSAALTAAYVARSLELQPIGVPPNEVTGAAARNGADPSEVYTRPFVTIWTALGNGSAYEDAVAAGLARAQATAAMDVQLTARETFDYLQRETRAIRGYRRVADGGACDFCKKVDGAFVKSASAMPLHNHCGCGLEPILSPAPVTPVPDGVAIHRHGELGAVLGDPEHSFTGPAGVG